MKLVVISICLNEEKTIGKLLKLIPKKIDGINKTINLVVDDGSVDKTAQIAEKNGAIVIKNIQQKRLAYAFQIAVEKALELGADIAVNIDGDLQFDPKEIQILIKPILQGKADFVAGNRFIDRQTGKARKPKGMPFAKYYGNRLGTFIIGRLSGQKFDDVTCGFRAYNRKALLNINLNSSYTYTQESFQMLALKRLNIVQVPVGIKYFKGRKSRVVTSIFSFILTSAINIIRAFRDFAPLTFFGILGIINFIVGAICFVFISYHYLKTGEFSPYKFIGFAGIYFISLAIIIWLFGLSADIFSRVINNQEKILVQLKELKYKKMIVRK